MIPALSGLVLGAAFGWWRAARRGGNRLDCAQYAAAHGIFFFILGMVISITLVQLL